MKKLYKFLSILGLSLFMTSCYYDAYIEIPNIDNGGVDPVGVSFATDVEPLFARCVGCHGGNTNPDLRPGNAYGALVPAYVTAGDADNSSLYMNLPGVGHPVDVGFTLNANELAVIKAWINEGAKNN